MKILLSLAVRVDTRLRALGICCGYPQQIRDLDEGRRFSPYRYRELARQMRPSLRCATCALPLCRGTAKRSVDLMGNCPKFAADLARLGTGPCR